MIARYPIACDVRPRNLSKGTQTQSVKVKNIGDQELTNLEVKLNSLDTYAIAVQGTGSTLEELLPGVEQEISFQVQADSRGQVYVSVDGWKALRFFHWESGAIPIDVNAQVAAIANLSAMTERHPPAGKSIRCEALLEGYVASQGLVLELWAGTPGGELTELARVETKALAPGESVVYATEFTPQEQGLYTCYAYLAENDKRIDRQVEHVYVIPAQK